MMGGRAAVGSLAVVRCSVGSRVSALTRLIEEEEQDDDDDNDDVVVVAVVGECVRARVFM